MIFCEAVFVQVGDVRLGFVSGCIPRDAEGELVGPGDVAAQTRQCLVNLQGVLERAGGSLRDVTRIRLFVVGPSSHDAVQATHVPRTEFFSAESCPASTLVFVQGLGAPGALVEIEAEAVLSGGCGRPRQPVISASGSS